MLSLNDVAGAFERGKAQFEALMSDDAWGDFCVAEQYGKAEAQNTDKTEANRIAHGDNLHYMMYLLKNRGMAGKLQLIYVDPPFFTKGQYASAIRLNTPGLGQSPFMKLRAYDDRWEQGMKEYLTMLTVRLFVMWELLSNTGCIWIHLDWHAVHYVKLLMDQIFGEKNFVNEVVWTYKSGGANKRSFAKKHDTLLFYGKSREYYFDILKEKSYNRGFKPYRFKGVKEYRDETGWYTMVNMKDVWNIDMVGRTSGERTGYATQKPEKLLERIVGSCSRAGDLCADFFAGSGTMGAVCEKMGRRWVLCDAGRLSLAAQVERLGLAGASFLVEQQPDFAEQPSDPVKLAPAETEDAASSDEAAVQGDLDVAVFDDKIELRHYDTEVQCVQPESREAILRYMEDDSLCMIRCWSVDSDHDGAVHRSDKIMSGSQRICYLPEGEGRISITGYDVLGNRFFKTLEIGGNCGKNERERNGSK